jgi:group I intron endonuclease
MVNGKVYVGQTKNFAARKAGHLYAARKGLERPLYHSMRKHGAENFIFEVLEECADEVVNERESHWVAHFDSFNSERGYNLTSGGGQGTEVSESTRSKLREMFSGAKNPMFGTHRFGENAPTYGMHHPSWHRPGSLNPMHGRRGELSPWTGRTHSQKAKDAIGKANSLQQRGERNSQFGTCWINSKIEKRSMKIKVEDLGTFLSTGWEKGRKMKWSDS